MDLRRIIPISPCLLAILAAATIPACGSSSAPSVPDAAARGADANPAMDAGADALQDSSRDAIARDAADGGFTTDASPNGEREAGADAEPSDGSGDVTAPTEASLPCIGEGGTPTVLAFGAGGTNTCAVLGDHSLWCWGNNDYGQIGDGTTTTRLLPVPITSLGTGVAAVTCGSNQQTCALMLDQTVRCWGDNSIGSLGDGTTTSSPIPVTVTGLAGVVELHTGAGFTCARKGDGSVWCWGDNSMGELGDGTTTDRSIPVIVTGVGTSAVELVGGWLHACIRRADGTVWCWGDNGSGALGDGTFTNATDPVQVSGLTGATAIRAGAYDTCAIKSDGTFWCWGYNHDGQMNDGTTNSIGVPEQLTALGSSVAQSAEGFSASFALKLDGTVWYWGYGTVTGLSQVPGVMAKGLVAGDDHECVLDTQGVMECFGLNTDGQLGDGTTIGRATPAPVALSCP